MCWETEDELYNGGQAFKVCARDARGVIVTVIADNYFGYCKKEVKTQISYSANLFGNAEEEHSGGALVFASYNLGQEYDEKSSGDGYTLAEVLERDPERFVPQPEGHADDREQPHIVLVPGGAHYSMRDMTVTWPRPDGGTGSMPLRADKAYLSPNGYRVTVAQQPHDPSTWTLIGTVAERHVVPQAGHRLRRRQVRDLQGHHRRVHRRLGVRRRASRPTWTRSPRSSTATSRGASSTRERNGTDLRPILSRDRSVGSVIKLLTPSRSEYTAEYNAWLVAHPALHQRARLRRQALLPPGVGRRLAQPLQRRRDRRPAGQRAAPRRRQDHPQHAAGRLRRRRVVAAVQPAARLLARGEGADPGRHHGLHRRARAACSGSTRPRSYKLVENCENLLFQRPDDAIHRGYDKQAERDIATPGNFLSNFEPLTRADAVAMRDEAVVVHRVQPADGRT